MHSTPWRGRGKCSERGRRKCVGGKQREGRDERQAETGNGLESQINKNTGTGTSIKRQNDKELEYQNQINKGEKTTLRKCTNRNIEAENESWAKGRERKKRTGGEAGQDRQINLKGHRQSRKGPWWPSRGPQQC